MFPLFLAIHHVLIVYIVHDSTWTIADSPYVLAIWTMLIIKAYSVVVWKTAYCGLAVTSKIMVIDFVNLTLQEGVIRIKWTSDTTWQSELPEKLRQHLDLESFIIIEASASSWLKFKVLHIKTSLPLCSFLILSFACLCTVNMFCIEDWCNA